MEYIDKNGDKAIDIEYEGCKDFSEGLAFVVKDEKGRFINIKGEFMEMKHNYKYMLDGGDISVSDGLVAVCINGNWWMYK